MGSTAIEASYASDAASSTQDLRVEVARVRAQNLTFMNELNERNGEIAAFKRRQDVLEATLKAKEKVYEQDIEVRMKLGRRLEQIFLDKEEVMEELYEVKEHAQRLEAELARYRAMEMGLGLAGTGGGGGGEGGWVQRGVHRPHPRTPLLPCQPEGPHSADGAPAPHGATVPPQLKGNGG